MNYYTIQDTRHRDRQGNCMRVVHLDHRQVAIGGTSEIILFVSRQVQPNDLVHEIGYGDPMTAFEFLRQNLVETLRLHND